MRRIAILLGVVCCGGCATVLKESAPAEPLDALPARFAATDGGESSGAGQLVWHTFFRDPALDALIERALGDNQELRMRQQEILIARADVMARQGEYLPRLDAVASAGVDKVGEHTSQGVGDEAHDVANPLARYRIGATASWEVDAWQRLRAGARAANVRYLASVEGRNFVVTQVVAELASSYYELLAIDRQLEVLGRNISLQEDALAVIRLQKQAARATELAVQRFEAEVLKNQGRRYRLEQQRVEAENRINVLLGRYPQPVVPDPARIDERMEAVDAGIPSALLDHRPDVRQAALELEAAKLDVRSARAAFFPSLRIEAGAGYDSFEAKHLLQTPGSMVFGLAGQLVAPLLNRRAIAAQYVSANAQQRQAVLRYERTLLQAFTEVANQLAMVSNLEKSYALQSRQVETLTRSIDVSNVLFQAARADYMEVLLTRRDALEAQMELIETRNQQLQARVRMYQALGGGWR